MFPLPSLIKFSVRCIATGFLVLVVSGCVTDTASTRSSLTIPGQWQTSTDFIAAKEAASWWKEMGSQELSTLLEQTLAANRDLHIARARVAQARALAVEADANRLPQLNAQAGASKGRQTILDPQVNSVHAGLQASWELDFFGQNALASEAAQLDAQSSALMQQASELVIAAELANAYLDAGILKKREVLMQQRQQILEAAVSTVRKQFMAGRATQADINRALSLQQGMQSELVLLHSHSKQRLMQIAVLRGVTPDQLKLEFADFDQIKIHPAALWQPGELLERRPDVQRFARDVEAASARVGVAKRDLYPHFQFNWLHSRESATISGQDNLNGIALGYGVSLSLPILDGGRIRSRIAVSEARLEEAMAAYEKSMLDALADAEVVLLRQKASAASLAELKQSTVNQKYAMENTHRLFTAGLVDRGGVLESEHAWLQAQDAELQAQGAWLMAGVDVYRAFSGKPEDAGQADVPRSN